jgi:uncharacterized protein YkwD
MNRLRFGGFVSFGAVVMLTGCSAMADSITTGMRMARDFQPVLIVAPSNTPFLPARDTPTPTPTDFPTATLPPTETPTVIDPPSPTPAPTDTQVILPSVTPYSPAVYPTKIVPTQKPPAIPTATAAKKAAAPPAATKTPTKTVIPTPTPIPTDTPDPSLWTPTNTLTGSETATPTATNTPVPTPTPTPTATRTAAPAPTNPFPGCSYTLNESFEQQIFERINKARAEAGLWPLTWYAPLAEGARYHSIDMGCNRYFAHTGGVYENILGGYNTVEEAWTWWWNSKPHHDNILGQYYYKVGVGYAWVSGSPYRYYWTIQFSR